MAHRELALPIAGGREANAAGGAEHRGRNRGFQRWLTRTHFLRAIVIVPTIVACVYYSLIATNRYVSEAVYVVRSVDSHRASGLEMLFQTFGVARTVDDANAVESYLMSRDAVRDLEQRVPLRKIYRREGIDIFARFPRIFHGDSFENLYEYYLDRVYVVNNSSKGISELHVTAFNAEDARQIAEALLSLAEQFVNRLNARSQTDAIRFAREEREAAQKAIAQSQGALNLYRNREQLVDPAASSISLLETITTLSTDLASAKAQLANLKKSSPDSPAVAASSDQIASLETAISAERQKMAGGDTALAAKLSSYEDLVVDVKLAESRLAAASLALQSAIQEARRQSIYLEEIVTPNLPDESTEPNSLRIIASVFVLSFAAASVIWLVTAGAREHMIE